VRVWEKYPAHHASSSGQRRNNKMEKAERERERAKKFFKFKKTTKLPLCRIAM
jgi:hypothetical protein